MKPDKLTVHELFQRERVYVVPLYQRAYVWTQEEQWELLWEDIERQAEACLAAPNNVAPRSHFLGAVVLNVAKIVGASVARSEIIDGQQRLTTLQLFLAALRDYATAVNSVHAAKIRRLTTNEDEKEGSESSFKVLPTNADRVAFRAVMTAGSRDGAMKAMGVSAASGLPRIAGAYVYFSGEIAAYAEGPPARSGDPSTTAEARDNRIFGLLQALRTALQVVVIELEANDDPQVIFETLNARGQPLLPSDLIRNFVFLQAANDPALDPDTLYNTYWRPFDDRRLKEAVGGENRFWHLAERQGRLTRPRIDLFMFHYLVMKTERELNIGTLFREFRDWRDSEATSAEVFLADLKAHSDVFATLVEPTDQSRASTLARRLKALDTSTVYPFLLFLLSLPEERLAAAQRDQIIDDVESWLVRRFVCVLTNKNYNGFFVKLLGLVKNAEPSVDLSLVVRAELSRSADATLAWPDDDQFRHAWLNNAMYVRSRPDRSGMLLRAIEDRLHTSRNEAVVLPAKLSVEHLLPQQGKLSDYPFADSMPLASGETPERCRARLIHSMGNLTLLTGELNSSVSNGPFPGKVKGIVADSDLRLNAWLRESPPATWSEASILDRGRQLFCSAASIWPAPASPPAESVGTPAEPAGTPAEPVREVSTTKAAVHPAPEGAVPESGLASRDGAAGGQDHGFEAAMRNIYTRATQETSYRPSYFLQMIEDRGGLAAARALLAGRPSDGFTRLWELKRLDLSVEALVLDPRWRSLFDESELAVAKRRLAEVGFAANPTKA